MSNKVILNNYRRYGDRGIDLAMILFDSTYTLINATKTVETLIHPRDVTIQPLSGS